MRLEHLSVALRQRDPWEAMDLGRRAVAPAFSAR
jgi:hypothetical protein